MKSRSLLIALCTLLLLMLPATSVLAASSDANPTVAASTSTDDLPTIAEIVVEQASADEPEFTTLLAAVQAADPLVLNTLSDETADVTVFAPTDAAFEALKTELGETAFNDLLANQPALTNILLYHVLGESLEASEVIGRDGEFVETLYAGFDVVIRVIDGDVFINDSKVVTTDIQASNGVIHVIDTVLQPVDQTIADVVVANATGDPAEFTTLLAAVQAADPLVLNTLADPDQELTVFAPTDAAFEALKTELGETAFNDLLADQPALTNILLYHVI
ncbi:MAG: fasciclin domain-containing protein, partial [Chloroflexi bacterium]|nr:fasciclin domain-containing protein [Chloroflexota bacterium]